MKNHRIISTTFIFCLVLVLNLSALAAPQASGDTTRISIATGGTQGNGNSEYPAIAPDGGYVAYQSAASNLVNGDTNEVSDIFVRDEVGSQTVRVSVDSNGSQALGVSEFPSISVTGRWVVFESTASNLVDDDTNDETDIFLHDRDTDADGIYDEAGFISTRRISVDSNGVEADGSSSHAWFSPDGRFVAFHSLASNLVSGDTNAAQDIFVRDLQTNTTVRVSVSSNGTQGNFESYYPSLSTSGRFVVFQSLASDLVSGDSNDMADIFVHDRDSDADGTFDEAGAVKTTRLSVDSNGMQSDNNSYFPSITGDGRYVVFYSYATNLISSDTNFVSDVFLHDRDTDADGSYDEAGSISTTRISLSSSGQEVNDDSYSYRSISEDGRFVAFHSMASNLASGDTNGVSDVYLHDNQTGITSRISVASNGTEGDNDSYFPAITANGKYVVFQSNATNLVSTDTNDAWDSFLHENYIGGQYWVYLPLTVK
jgi:hypothetical protein